MSLCCCGNFKWRLRSNSNANDIKSESKNINTAENVIQEEVVNEKEKYESNFTPPLQLDAEKHCLNDNVKPKVVLRTELSRQKKNVSVTDNANGVHNLNYSHSGKSVFHKNLRFDEDNLDCTNSSFKRQSSKFQKPYVAASRRGSLYIFKNADDVIITPFAQILASLRKIRANFMHITNINSENDERRKSDSPSQKGLEKKILISRELHGKMAQETLNELEWCLDRLENIQTHRSVSDMASIKFKQIINRELSQVADSSKSGHQISDYICKTFLDPQMDDSIQESSSFENDVNDKQKNLRNESVRRSVKLTKANTDPVLNRVKLDTDTLFKEEVVFESGVVDEEADVPYLGVHVTNEDEVLKILDEDLNRWGMNLFSFEELTGKQSLTVVSYAIFKQQNLIFKFQIDEKILIQFLIKAERTYRPKVPYHNNIHAADVTQSANILLRSPALENVFTDLELLSVIFASIIHDMDHPGVTNQYLINTNSELATLYNDISVLENHHLSMAFSLVEKDECDFLATLSKRHRQSMRRMVIDMVLATDMSKHMTLLADLKTMVETKKVSGSGILTLDTYTDRIQILQNLIHCADLSNPTKPLDIYKMWNDRVMEEFYLQGDKERANDLEISPMCDRQSASLEKSQVSFIDFIVHPLWETWSELVYPDTQDMLEALEENRQYYFKKSQEKAVTLE